MTTFLDVAYRQFVDQLAKPGDEIAASLTADRAHLLHMVVGISGEAGELLDAVKKHVIYNKDLDMKNVIEELGDLEFYMQGVRNGLGLTRATVIEHNMKKLGARYEAGYSDKAAQERADKNSTAKGGYMVEPEDWEDKKPAQVALMSCMMCGKVKNQTPDGVCTACKTEMPDEAA